MCRICFSRSVTDIFHDAITNGSPWPPWPTTIPTMPLDNGRERRQRQGRYPNVFGNQRLMTFSAIAMLIVIIEFQGIHEARVHHMKLRELHEQEQSTLQMIEKDLMTALSQAGQSLSDHVVLDPGAGTSPEELHPQDEVEAELMAAIRLAGDVSFNQPIIEKQPQQNANENKVALKPATPRVTSEWNLPTFTTNESLIPSALKNLADLSDPYSKELKEVPFFWHLAKSGGTSVKHMYSDCYGLVEACESGLAEGHHRDITLKVVTLESGWKFVNVDTTTPMGIERASRFNLARSGKADLVVSPLPHDVTSKLFLKQHRGRCFTIFRDPIDRVVSLFYYLQKASHEPTYNPALKDMTLDEYVNSNLAETNFVSRTLIDKMEAPLAEEDFLVAKEVLRTKCLVGLLDELEESVRRFDLYFGFGQSTQPDPICTAKYLKTGSNRHAHPSVPPPDSPTYQVLQRNNHMDIRLYQYARELFVDQARIFCKADATHQCL